MVYRSVHGVVQHVIFFEFGGSNLPKSKKSQERGFLEVANSKHGTCHQKIIFHEKKAGPFSNLGSILARITGERMKLQLF
jgi:hypothetical protein